MGTKTIITYSCDKCGSEDGVLSKRMTIDDHTVEVDSCMSCWQKTLAVFADWATHGRRLSKTRVKGKLMASPVESSWKWTSHALQRAGERHVDPKAVLLTVESPTLTRPGETADSEVRLRGGVKVVVLPERGVIVTVAHANEID